MIRRYLFPLLLLLLPFLSLTARAETIAATLSTTHYKWVNTNYCATLGQPCQTSNGLSWDAVNKPVADRIASESAATCTSYYSEPGSSPANNGCACDRFDGVKMQCSTSGAYRGSPMYECPSDQGWTLSGSTCTRPDCPYGINQSTGTCKGKCEDKANGPASNGWYIFNVGATPSGSYCNGGCSMMLQPDNTASLYYTNGQKNRIKMTGIYTGGECTQADNAPQSSSAAESPPDPPKQPPCAADEGVLTSSTGKIHCVPSSVPNAPKPVVKKEVEKSTNPDNSTTEKETITTRDPETGVEDKRSNTKNCVGTNCTSSSSSSQSGGGSNGTGTPDGSQANDLCTKNPTLDICTGKLNKEETQKKVADALSAEGFDPLTHLPVAVDASGEARQKADQGKDAVIGDIQKFGTSSDPSHGFYSQFQDQMGGWLGDIPVQGCVPFSAKIGPYQWNFDHCEKAAKIAEIFGYCLWVMLSFGVFSLATRNRG